MNNQSSKRLKTLAFLADLFQNHRRQVSRVIGGTFAKTIVDEFLIFIQNTNYLEDEE